MTTERSSFRPIDWPLVATCVGLALATFVRGWLVASRDFPLNDGALFYLMTEELGTNAFRLPTITAYNAANIPFAYSPLGFYVASALHLGLGIGLVDLFRFLPFFFGSLCVVGPRSRMTRQKLRELRPGVLAICKALSKRLGWRGGAAGG